MTSEIALHPSQLAYWLSRRDDMLEQRQRFGGFDGDGHYFIGVTGELYEEVWPYVTNVWIASNIDNNQRVTPEFPHVNRYYRCKFGRLRLSTGFGIRPGRSTTEEEKCPATLKVVITYRVVGVTVGDTVESVQLCFGHNHTHDLKACDEAKRNDALTTAGRRFLEEACNLDRGQAQTIWVSDQISRTVATRCGMGATKQIMAQDWLNWETAIRKERAGEASESHMAGRGGPASWEDQLEPARPLLPLLPIPQSLAPQIAAYSPVPADPSIEVAQAAHRINLVNTFASLKPDALRPGAAILELGCGQGNCTTVLATAVGPSGTVTALDPSPPDYGAPFTLAQAQAHISSSGVGPRIAWHTGTPLAELLSRPENAGRRWDVAVLVHCVWYFRTPSSLSEMLSLLSGRAGAVWVAEYGLRATNPAALPHVLAALARGSLEAHRGGQSEENIQTPLSAAAIKAVAAAAGWEVAGEACLVPKAGLLDGSWEVGTVVGPGFVEEVEAAVESERVRVVLRSARDATASAVQMVGGVDKVQTMDVWIAVLTEKAVPECGDRGGKDREGEEVVIDTDGEYHGEYLDQKKSLHRLSK